MREFIKIVEATMSEDLFEMPMLLTNKVTFGLENPEYNRDEYERLAEIDNKKVITQNKDFLLAAAFDLENHVFEIYLLSFREKALVYYVEFIPFKLPQLGNCASQIVLWRRAGAGLPNVTTKVFYDFLLKNYDSIVSDKSQTQDGRRFWIDRMAESAQKGLTVGLMHKEKIVSIYDNNLSFQEWLKKNNGWHNQDNTNGMNGMDFLYFISKKKF